MTTEAERKAVVREAAAALTRHLDERAVGIIAFRDGRPVDLASGTCIQVGERFFIATVAHLVCAYAPEDLFLVTQRERQYERLQIAGQGYRGGSPEDPVDVAWLELSSAVAERIQRHFVGIDRLQFGRDQLGRDIGFVYGFPTDKLGKTSAGLHLQPVGLVTSDVEERPAKARDGFDLYLAYPRDRFVDREGEPIPSHKPQGMSGGGIWAVEVNTAGVWSPEAARLVAIQHEWLPWRYLRGTQIQHWLRMVRDDVPELAGVIASVLP